LVLGVPELVGDVGGHVHVEAGERVPVLVAEARLVELDADADAVAAAVATFVAAVAVVAAVGSGVAAVALLSARLSRAGGKGEGPHGRQCGQRCSRCLHPWSPSLVTGDVVRSR